jgi:hypothetical protein
LNYNGNHFYVTERKGHVPDLAINQVKGNKPGRSGRITKYGEAYL